MNFDPRRMDGSHWVAIFAEGIDKDVLYYDSLALFSFENLNKKCQISNFLNQFPAIVRNRRAYQSYSSNTCGHHAICFIYFLSLGQKYEHFLKILENTHNPDLYVKTFVNKMIKNF